MSNLHKAQATTLKQLRRTPAARYSQLMRPTGLESDVFKFHLRKLVAQGLVRRADDGWYSLTAAGKEFANNLDDERRTVQKQPKLSAAVIAWRQVGTSKEYLFQTRLRNPYYGFVGCITGPVRWGESFELAAGRELAKQTGLAAEYRLAGFHRQTDHRENTGDIYEDKLFAIVEAYDLRGELSDTWPGGSHVWLSLERLQEQEKVFPSSLMLIRTVESSGSYSSLDSTYSDEEY